MTRKILLGLSAVLLLGGCAIPQYSWQKPGGDAATLAADEKACWDKEPPWFVTPGSIYNDPIRRTGFKDCMEARGWTKNEVVR